MYKKYKEKIIKHFKQIIEDKPTPHEIALGFAIGTAIAILPTFGLGAIIGIFIAFIYKKINKVSLFFSFAIWNPFLLAPLTGLSYTIGYFILKETSISIFKFELLDKLFFRYIIGNLILTSILTVASYFIILHLSKEYFKKHSKELILDTPMKLQLTTAITQ